LHAKCVVVDLRVALVTSAEFTVPAPARNTNAEAPVRTNLTHGGGVPTNRRNGRDGRSTNPPCPTIPTIPTPAYRTLPQRPGPGRQVGVVAVQHRRPRLPQQLDHLGVGDAVAGVCSDRFRTSARRTSRRRTAPRRLPFAPCLGRGSTTF